MSSLYKKPPARPTLYSRYVKRPLDILTALIGIIITGIPMLIIAIIIKITTNGGPVLFPHTRIGRNSKEFTLYKFRSMRPYAEVTSSANLNPEHITGIGRILRSTSLDELPQLFNVLKGDMSLVGYRPVIPEESWLNESRERRGVLRTRPGITGLAQTHGRDKLDIRPKLEYDSQYAQKITFLGDCKVVFKSFGVLFTPSAPAQAHSRPSYRSEDVSRES